MGSAIREKKGFVLCENEEERRGIYREKGGGFRPFWVGKGGKLNLNVMEVGGVYGEEEVDVNGECGNWEEELM